MRLRALKARNRRGCETVWSTANSRDPRPALGGGTRGRPGAERLSAGAKHAGRRILWREQATGNGHQWPVSAGRRPMTSRSTRVSDIVGVCQQHPERVKRSSNTLSKGQRGRHPDEPDMRNHHISLRPQWQPHRHGLQHHRHERDGHVAWDDDIYI